jgi:hypothetical protein
MTDRVPGASPDQSQRGQVLVIVAIGLTVLLLFVALAVDVGFWYGQRRHMQNAADAGALAGAYELCHGTPSNYVAAATDYAERNGADHVRVLRVDANGAPNSESGTTVVVSATVDAPTFFSRLVLSDAISVSAVGAAACGEAVTGCGAMPIAFDALSYDDLPCSNYDEQTGKFTTYRTGSTFVLWADDNLSTGADVLCDKCNCGGPEGVLYSQVTDHFDGDTVIFDTATGTSQNWNGTIPKQVEFFNGGKPMMPGNRGWVRLGIDRAALGKEAAEDGSVCKNTENCGQTIECWVKYGFPAPIGLAVPPMCLETKPGTMSDVVDLAKDEVEHEVRTFVLFDGYCTGSDKKDPADYNCSSGSGGDQYRVAGIGCGLILHVYDKKNDGINMPMLPAALPCKKNANPNKGEVECPTCPERERGILVTKVCNCPAGNCTGTSGAPTGEGAQPTVSLISVPSVTWPVAGP